MMHITVKTTKHRTTYFKKEMIVALNIVTMFIVPTTICWSLLVLLAGQTFLIAGAIPIT